MSSFRLKSVQPCPCREHSQAPLKEGTWPGVERRVKPLRSELLLGGSGGWLACSVAPDTPALASLRAREPGPEGLWLFQPQVLKRGWLRPLGPQTVAQEQGTPGHPGHGPALGAGPGPGLHPVARVPRPSRLHTELRDVRLQGDWRLSQPSTPHASRDMEPPEGACFSGPGKAAAGSGGAFRHPLGREFFMRPESSGE